MELRDPEPGRRTAAGRVTLGFVARAALAVIGVWALANLVWMGRDLVFVAFFAALWALFLSIFVDRLEGVGVPRPAGAVLVALAFFGLLAGLGVLAWPALEEQFGILGRELPRAIGDAVEWAEGQIRVIAGEVVADDPLREQLTARLMAEATEIVVGALPLLNTIVGAAAGVLIVVFAGLYLAVEPRSYATGMARLVPPASRAAAVDALGAAAVALRRWMAGTAVNMVLVGALTTLGLMLLGIPAAFALGLIAGLLEFIPIFGPIIAAVPAIAVGLVESPITAIWVALLYIGVQQLESNVMTPLVMKGAVKLPPALTMVVQALMAVMFGFLGLLLAVPMLAATMVLVRWLYIEPIERRYDEGAEAAGRGDEDVGPAVRRAG